MVRLDSRQGSAALRQAFVFADVRPIRSRPLTVSIFATQDTR